MSAEVEEVMGRLRQTRNVTNSRGKLVTRQTRFLTPREQKMRQGEINWVNGVLDQPAWALKDLTPEKRARLISRRNQLEEDLGDNSAPRVSDDTKNSVYKLMQEKEERIQSSLLTGTVMHRNPAGAVGRYNKGENSPTIKQDILV